LRVCFEYERCIGRKRLDDLEKKCCDFVHERGFLCILCQKVDEEVDVVNGVLEEVVRGQAVRGQLERDGWEGLDERLVFEGVQVG